MLDEMQLVLWGVSENVGAITCGVFVGAEDGIVFLHTPHGPAECIAFASKGHLFALQRGFC